MEQIHTTLSRVGVSRSRILSRIPKPFLFLLYIRQLPAINRKRFYACTALYAQFASSNRIDAISRSIHPYPTRRWISSRKMLINGGSNLICAARLRQITPAVGIHPFKPQPPGRCKPLRGKAAEIHLFLSLASYIASLPRNLCERPSVRTELNHVRG